MAPLRTTSPRPVRVAAFPIVILMAILLGFLPASPRNEELRGETAAALQSLLVSVHQLAAQGEYAGALEHLDGLASEVAAQAAAGGISSARQQKISTALELVRADLEGLIQAAAEATPLVSAEPGDAPGAVQTVPAPPAPLPAPAPVPAPAPDVRQPPSGPGDNPGRGNPGGPRGNGKGN